MRSYEAEPQETKPAASVSVKLARGGLSVNGEGRLGGRPWGDARATPHTSHTNSAVAINGIILTSGESSEGSKLTKPDSERNASSTTRQTRLVIKTIICLSGPNLGKFNDNEFLSQQQ